MARTGRTWAAVMGTLGAVVLAGCGSSAQHPAPTTSPASPPTTTTRAAATTSATSGSDAATRAAITHAYTVFFASSSTSAQSEAVLQHGDQFRATLDQQSSNSYASTSSAVVTSLRVDSADVADVTFAIRSGSTTLLPSVAGKAVREAGTWKVAALTFCALLRLEGTPPAACSDASVTALPQ